MEDGHWQKKLTDIKIRVNSLNPYCNGRWSLTHSQTKIGWYPPVLILIVMEDGHWLTKDSIKSSYLSKGLNPYCNGRWSLTVMIKKDLSVLCKVLILIVMEDGHWPLWCSHISPMTVVLILIVMEDGHWPEKASLSTKTATVLILIVMEDGHWHPKGNGSMLSINES